MKWEKGLLVSIGFFLGGPSYASLPEIVNLGSYSNLAQALLPALDKVGSIPKGNLRSIYHGFFPYGEKGLLVKCSTKEARIYIFEGCEVSKAAAKDTTAPHLTAE